MNNENLFDLNAPTPSKKPSPKCIVRLTTTCWKDKRGIHTKKSLLFLNLQCEGYNILEEDVSVDGAEEAIDRIINLYECKDGIYQVVTCNEWASWETPHIIEDYDYKLIPLK
jgi:hypothetical protein